jgi:amino acid/amide ABC transporter substrate-binding protein, HAAT family (TC 3.A.1.4.-)
MPRCLVCRWIKCRVAKISKAVSWRKYQPIQLYAPYCYDAVNVMIAAMQRADSVDPQKYLPELAKTDLDGITAKIQFDAKGDLKGGAVTLYQVQQGKWQPLETLGVIAPAAVSAK